MEIFKKFKVIYEKVRFWLYGFLENGIIYLNKGQSLDEAIGKVRKGGYVVCLPTNKRNSYIKCKRGESFVLHERITTSLHFEHMQ